MVSGKQILLEKLLKYSSEEIPSGQENVAAEIIRASFLLHGSHTPDNLKCVSEISYKKADDVDEKTTIRQGLFFNKIQGFLSDFVYELANVETIPPAISEKYPEISLEEYWSALHVVVLLLTALEWDNRSGGQSEHEDSPELQEKLLKASMQEYNDYMKEEREGDIKA